MAGRAPVGTARRVGGHVRGAVRPGPAVSDTAGRQTLAAAGGAGWAGIDTAVRMKAENSA